MKFLLLSSLCCILVAVSQAATVQGFFSDPKYPGKCVVKDVIFSPGEEVQLPNSCGIMICNARSSVLFHTCGVAPPPRGRKLRNNNKSNEPYPYCCFKDSAPLR